MKEVPLRPEMIPVLQTLADPMNQAQAAFDQAKAALAERQKVWAEGLALCAFQLGLKPEMIVSFDAAKAIFTVKPPPDESSAPLPSAEALPARPTLVPSARTAAQPDPGGTPLPLVP